MAPSLAEGLASEVAKIVAGRSYVHGAALARIVTVAATSSRRFDRFSRIYQRSATISPRADREDDPAL
jgi:hypothetical protein